MYLSMYCVCVYLGGILVHRWMRCPTTWSPHLYSLRADYSPEIASKHLMHTVLSSDSMNLNIWNEDTFNDAMESSYN